VTLNHRDYVRVRPNVVVTSTLITVTQPAAEGTLIELNRQGQAGESQLEARDPRPRATMAGSDGPLLLTISKAEQALGPLRAALQVAHYFQGRKFDLQIVDWRHR
jgi:hypothetical protein